MNSQTTISAIRQDLSLFIPYSPIEFSKEYITGIFEAFGTVCRVDFVCKINRNGQEYNNAYVHFSEWVDTMFTRKYQARVLTPEGAKISINHYPYVWKVYENKAVKHIPGERRQRINLQEDSAPEPATYDSPEKTSVLTRTYTESNDYEQQNMVLRAENERLRAALDEMEKKSMLAAHSSLIQHKRAARYLACGCRFLSCACDPTASAQLKMAEQMVQEESRKRAILEERVAELENENAELQKTPTNTDLFQSEVRKHAAVMNRSQIENQEAKITELESDNSELKQQLHEQAVYRHMSDTFHTDENKTLKKYIATLEFENQMLRDGPEEEPKHDGEWPQESVEAIIERENLIDQIVSIIQNSPTFTDAKNNVQVLYKDSPYYPIASYLIPTEPQDEPEQTFDEWQEEYKDWQNEVGFKR
jgi:hypothetical protein